MNRLVSRRDKLIAALTNHPHNATFSEVAALLVLEGFVLDRVSGSHHIFEKNETILVLPVHKNRVKAVYVRRVLELIRGEGETP